MTYYDCRLLGLKTDWTNDTGLIIEKNEDYFYEYIREVNDNKNANKQIAKIAADKITVNGKVIDNNTEEYPLLVFRDVTYFPLTWRFAVNEFGWNYTFDQKNGLVIQNDNVKLENPEDYHWQGNSMAGTTGLGSGKLAIQAYEPIQIERAVLQTSTTNDLMPGKIFIIHIAPQQRFEDLTLRYQIYKTVGQREELVYNKIMPSYQGIMEPESWYQLETPINYWTSAHLQTGTYKLHLGLPNDLQCYDLNNQLQPYHLTTDTDYLEIGDWHPELQDCYVVLK